MAPRVIAIDGPAASGKSSTGALVAERLGWAHLDSGALYRAMTLAALDNLGDEGGGKGEGWNPQRIVALAQELPITLALVGREFVPTVAGVDVAAAWLADPGLYAYLAEDGLLGKKRAANDGRQSVITITAKGRKAFAPLNKGSHDQVAAMLEQLSVAEQQRVVRQHPAGVVVDGRDIGTVVFPDAPLKVFLTATPEERARRRLTQRGQAPDAERVRRESQALAARDDADRERPVAPLKPAADAVLLDTTHVSLEEQVARVVALARARFRG